MTDPILLDKLSLADLSGRAPGAGTERDCHTPSVKARTKLSHLRGTAVEAFSSRTERHPQRGYKLVVEVAGTGLEGCCSERITSAAVKQNPVQTIDPGRCRELVNDGPDKYRCEVTISGITRYRRHIYLDPGCSDDSDAACPIPLQPAAQPVDTSAQAASWPTVLVPLVPLACTDPAQSADTAEPLRQGWLYVYVNGRLWRELYASGDHTFRDVNLALPTNAGRDVREPTGRVVNSIIVPHTLDGDHQHVSIAFSEVQWPWHTVCAMGGPADDDPRFTPQVIARARQIPLDDRRRNRRFTPLDLSGYPVSFDTPDGRVRDIKTAPCAKIDGNDPLQRYRDSRIAAVYLHDPLLIARRLAGAYQQAWRDMENLLQALALAPVTCVKERRYDPGRWFDSALLANQFFFSPFPSCEQWCRLHPEADRQKWRHAKQQRDEMCARLDKKTIDEALGVARRNELRPGIDLTKQALVDYLNARTRDERDLLVLMIDDYFLLPNPYGTGNDRGKSPFGYVDGWSVIEQLIARLADHCHTLDVALQTQPPDTAGLTRKDPGVALLNAIADPAQGHPLHGRLFPKPGRDCWTPDQTSADPHAPYFKPQQFKNAQSAHMGPVSAFAAHFAKAALVPATPAVQQSLVRLANAALALEMTAEETELEKTVQHATRHALSPQKSQALIGQALQGSLQPVELTAWMRRWTLFIKGGIDHDTRQTDDPFGHSAMATMAVTDKHTNLPADTAWKLSAKDLHGYSIERILSGRSAMVKNPLPDTEKGVITFPEQGPPAGLEVMDPSGKPIGTLSIDDFQRGRVTTTVQWGKDRHLGRWRPHKAGLLVSRDPGLLARFSQSMTENRGVSHVIVPLMVMFETWNVCHAAKTLHDQWNSDEDVKAWVDSAGSLVDFSALDASLIHARVVTKRHNKKISKGERIKHPSFRGNGTFSGLLGAGAGAYSAFPSGRDMIVNIRPHHDAAMLTEFGLGTLHLAAWRYVLLAGESALPHLTTNSSGAFSWIDLGTVLAGLALPAFIFRANGSIEDWLTHGPFSSVSKKQIGRVGTPFDEADSDDSSIRFAGHRPGDVDWGPPAGGEQKIRKYPGSCRMMEFWKEPDGSFLWIDRQGTIVDWKIKTAGRLVLKNGQAYLKVPEGQISLGGMFQPIQNRDRLFVDRKDNGDRFRNWCERPRSAYHALTDALLAPQIDVHFTKTKTIANPITYQEMVYHATDPIEGFIHTAHIHVAIPHFIPGQSRLYLQMWHQHNPGPDTIPKLAYAEEIVLQTDPQRPLRQITVHWPFAWEQAQRDTWITVKFRLDLHGDGMLCLPLKEKGMSGVSDNWMIVKTLADRETMPIVKNDASEPNDAMSSNAYRH